MIEVRNSHAVGHVAMTIGEGMRSDEVETTTLRRRGQSVVDQHGDGAAGELSDSEVRLAVAVEIDGGNIDRSVGNWDLLHRLEIAVAKAHENRDLILQGIASDQVQIAVAVDVQRKQVAGACSGGRAYRDRSRRLKRILVVPE